MPPFLSVVPDLVLRKNFPMDANARLPRLRSRASYTVPLNQSTGVLADFRGTHAQRRRRRWRSALWFKVPMDVLASVSPVRQSL